MRKTSLNAILLSLFAIITGLIVPIIYGQNTTNTDYRRPEINISSPKNGSKHNYFPTITGTAKFISIPDNSVGSSQLRAIVEARISIQASGKVWNGQNWFLPKTNEEVYPVQATINGENWQFTGNLPSKNQDYTISVLATDNIGAKYTSSIVFSVVPIELTVIDANKQYTGIDFSNDFRGNISETQIDFLLKKVGLETPAVGGNIDMPSKTINTEISNIENAQKLAEYYQTKALEILKLRRLAAVADGVTKLLVIAKGVNPGTVTFERTSNSELASKQNCYEKTNGLGAARFALNGQSVNLPYGSGIPQSFQFCTVGNVMYDRFSSFESYNSATNTPFYKKSENTYYWFALYTVPPDINHETNPAPIENSILGHIISLNAVFTPQSEKNSGAPKQQDLVSYPFFLFRPPVLLVHGLDDKASSWDLKNNTVLQDAGFDVRTLDYRKTKGEGFETNKLALLSSNVEYKDYDETDPRHLAEAMMKPVKSEGVLEILESYRKAGIAISQVDVVGHSMGGLLARIFSQQPEYWSDNNFKQGYIRRLITIGTPHFGSNVANIMVNDVNKYGSHGCAAIGFWWESDSDENKTGNLNASIDLQIGSLALSKIKQTKILSHAIVSIDNSLILRGEYEERYKAVKSCQILNGLPIQGMASLGTPGQNRQSDFIKSLCNGQPCDWTVQAESQAGGLNKPYITVFPNQKTARQINHGEEISSVEIRERVLELLKGRAEDFSTDGFPEVKTHNLLASVPAVKVTSPIINKLAIQNKSSNNKDKTKIKINNASAMVDSRTNNKDLTTTQMALLEKIKNSGDISDILKVLPPEQQKQFEKTLREAASQMPSKQNSASKIIEKKSPNPLEFRQFNGGNLFFLKIPIGWNEETPSPMTVIFTPEDGKSGSQIIRGLAVEATSQKWNSLNDGMQVLIQSAIQKNPYLRVQSQISENLSGRSALTIKLSGISEKTMQVESLVFSGVLLESGNLLYVAMFYPENESQKYLSIFKEILDSLKINNP